MEIRRGMRFAILSFGRHPAFDIVFLYLPETEVPAAIYDDAIRYLERLQCLLRVRREFLVVPYASFMRSFAEDNLFELVKLVHAHQSFGVFAVRPRFPSIAWRERKILERKLL